MICFCQACFAAPSMLIHSEVYQNAAHSISNVSWQYCMFRIILLSCFLCSSFNLVQFDCVW